MRICRRALALTLPPEFSLTDLSSVNVSLLFWSVITLSANWKSQHARLFASGSDFRQDVKMKGNYPSRIVCLTEETTETLYRIGESERIVGISGFTVRPPRARKEKPRVSAFTSAKIDRILALTPDLVLGFSDLQADIARELIASGVSVLVFNQRSVERAS